ncbi:dienelactone hydrolase family protein [Amycolatopsis dongchuanensis]|uniref:Dienelactone hydrolase family protein n=1 Tax=Amycolatopsis dongchuanensis TaxID=1070866 RepID=A0ABP9QAQ5_9PSEU
MNAAPEPAGDWLQVSTSDGPMRVYRVRPADPVSPPAAVLVLQEAFGVNEHVQDVTRRVAAEGYLALAPELFHRTGGGTVDYADRDTAMGLIDAISPDQIDTDVVAVLEHVLDAENIPVQRCAVVGFCFGGRAAITAATSTLGLGATVAFYGPGVVAGPHAVLDRVENISGPVLVLVGDQDPTIPAEHRDALRAAADEAGVDLRIRVFPGAGHAFHCDARPAMYHEEAAREAWQLTTSFLAETIGKGRP